MKHTRNMAIFVMAALASVAAFATGVADPFLQLLGLHGDTVGALVMLAGGIVGLQLFLSHEGSPRHGAILALMLFWGVSAPVLVTASAWLKVWAPVVTKPPPLMLTLLPAVTDREDRALLTPTAPLTVTAPAPALTVSGLGLALVSLT